MSWDVDYKRKLMSPGDALRCVESGMRVYIHPGCAEPEVLVEALMERAPYVRDVEIVHLMTMGKRAVRGAGDGGTLPAQRHVHRRQRARGGERRPRRLHAGVPERDRGAVRERAIAAGRGADPGIAAGRARLLLAGRGRGHDHDGGALRQVRGRAGERPDAAHLRRLLPARRPDRRVRGNVASAVRGAAGGDHGHAPGDRASTWRR